MTTQLTVSASEAAALAGSVPQVIASLPVSLAPGADDADLVAVDGSVGWPQAVEQAIDAGVRGVVVVRPVAADVTSVREKSDAAGVPVVIDSMWRYNPAVQTSVAPFAEVNDGNALLEARVYAATGSDWDRVLLDQLSVIRAAVSPVARLNFARRSDQGYAALAVLASGSRASITAIRTDSVAESATLRIVRPEHMVELEVPAPLTAIPGRVRVSGPDGSALLETKWETAHRAAWRALHALVVEGRTSSDLADFSEDLALATA